MVKNVKVSFRNIISAEFPVGTTLLEVSEHFKEYYNYPILIAKMDNNIVNLNRTIEKRCTVDFYDRTSTVGNGIFANSVQLMLIVAVKRVLGADTEVLIQNSIDKGVYCEVVDTTLTKTIVKKIETEMYNLVKENLLFTRMSVSRVDAIKYFKKKKQMDKVKVLKYISNSFVNLYRLDDVYDYFFGEMAHSTKDIDNFKLTHVKGNGFVLAFPNIYNPEVTFDYIHHKDIFDKFCEYGNWIKTIGVSNAADLNEIVSQGRAGEIVRLSEALYDTQLSKIAEEVYENRNNIKLVLIAGPSSSGKTTTANRLKVFLGSKGFRTHTISLDDYFVDREKTPRDEDGEYDFESLRAIDLELFNKQLAKLLDGEKVLLPEYNFILGKREYKKKWLQLKDNDIIVIEGLHALNDEVTLSVERRNKYKIYISPLTQLNIDNHNRIHTSDTRRLRRIVRDSEFRGHDASATLTMMKKVRRGEEKYVFPFQDDNDMVVNTALVYEIGILKVYAEPLLFAVPEDDENYPEALRLINFLRNFLPIPADDVPGDSILREFIGGSSFDK